MSGTSNGPGKLTKVKKDHKEKDNALLLGVVVDTFLEPLIDL